VPAATLLQAYRQGEVEFIRWCIQDLAENTDGDRDDVLLAALTIFETVTSYVNRALSLMLTAYEEDREQWLQYNSVVFASRITDLLEADSVDVPTLERELDYKLSGFHLGLVLWLDEPVDKNPLILLEGAVEQLARSAGFAGQHLLLPSDQTSALAWLATTSGSPPDIEAIDRLLAAYHPGLAVAMGKPGQGVQGLRRTHEQANSAQMVAVAAGAARARVTPYESIAPIAMVCSDMKSARRWVSDTLGGLAVQSDRNAMLRETVRAFLESDGSFMATADQLSIHRNTAQYRVRKAEEVRGRPLRDGRLDVELALLACHWLGEAVLQSVG
jgi:DNA-binding PucR family transcriptional regulator